MKYVCDVCGWVYDEAAGDPEHGIAPGTKFSDLPADFECPLCGVGKDQFSAEYIARKRRSPRYHQKNVSAFDRQVRRLWNPVDFPAISTAAQAAIKESK